MDALGQDTLERFWDGGVWGMPCPMSVYVCPASVSQVVCSPYRPRLELGMVAPAPRVRTKSCAAGGIPRKNGVGAIRSNEETRVLLSITQVCIALSQFLPPCITAASIRTSVRTNGTSARTFATSPRTRATTPLCMRRVTGPMGPRTQDKGQDMGQRT